MIQLILFPDLDRPPLTGRRLILEADVELEDPLGLWRSHLPRPPTDDPAFDRFGLFVEDLPRKELGNARAEHRIPWRA